MKLGRFIEQLNWIVESQTLDVNSEVMIVFMKEQSAVSVKALDICERTRALDIIAEED